MRSSLPETNMNGLEKLIHDLVQTTPSLLVFIFRTFLFINQSPCSIKESLAKIFLARQFKLCKQTVSDRMMDGKNSENQNSIARLYDFNNFTFFFVLKPHAWRYYPELQFSLFLALFKCSQGFHFYVQRNLAKESLSVRIQKRGRECKHVLFRNQTCNQAKV